MQMGFRTPSSIGRQYCEPYRHSTSIGSVLLGDFLGIQLSGGAGRGPCQKSRDIDRKVSASMYNRLPQSPLNSEHRSKTVWRWSRLANTIVVYVASGEVQTSAFLCKRGFRQFDLVCDKAKKPVLILLGKGRRRGREGVV